MSGDYQYLVESTNIDINNDGEVENIVRNSVFSEKYNIFFYQQNVVLGENLDFKFYGGKYSSEIPGEVFSYRGRYFSIDLHPAYNWVNEFFPSPYGEKGISVKRDLCRFE